MIQNLNSKANSEEVDFLFISFEFVSEMRYICLLLNRSHVLSGENDNAGQHMSANLPSSPSGVMDFHSGLKCRS